MRAMLCGARADTRAELWLSHLGFLVDLFVWFAGCLCFRVRREQAIMKRSGGGLHEPPGPGSLFLGERRGRGG